MESPLRAVHWGTADAEIKILPVENPKLNNVLLPVVPAAGQNIYQCMLRPLPGISSLF